MVKAPAPPITYQIFPTRSMRRLQSFRSFLPLGRAYFSIVCGNKLCSFYLAQQLVGGEQLVEVGDLFLQLLVLRLQLLFLQALDAA